MVLSVILSSVKPVAVALRAKIGLVQVIPIRIGIGRVPAITRWVNSAGYRIGRLYFNMDGDIGMNWPAPCAVHVCRMPHRCAPVYRSAMYGPYARIS